MLIPNGYSIDNNIAITSYPSYTYKFNLDTNSMASYLDGVESVKQGIFKVLQTNRYQYLIYDWRYGIEISDLFGKNPKSILGTLQTRIIDCLMVDDRILSLDNFVFAIPERNTVLCNFTATTNVGNIDIKGVKFIV